ncbi:MAG: helix-turn-helix transcriptional regulator [Clostridia bacterium]|nr:helix-turn-helix transcriptional regulator [Clostridia bacterium]
MIFNGYAEGREMLAGVTLVSCGHVFAKPNREICRPQGREDWLLFYVAKEEEVFLLDEAITAKAGAFVLFAPGERQHHVYKGSKTAEFYYVHFKADALPCALGLATSHVYQLTEKKQYGMLFEEMIEETIRKKPHYETVVLSQLFQLFGLLARGIAQASGREEGTLRGVKNAIGHMNKHFDSNFSLQDYAALCHMSKYHFLRVFREVTGTTPLAYRMGIRLEHAKELLLQGYLSVCEISEMLGFSSPAYFSDVFRRSVGVPPSEYGK